MRPLKEWSEEEGRARGCTDLPGKDVPPPLPRLVGDLQQ